MYVTMSQNNIEVWENEHTKPGPGKLGSGPRKMLMGSSGWEIEVQAGVGDGEVEMRAVRQGGGREERMRLRSARASRGREDLWRIASCTERKRSQERAMGVVRSSRASFFLRYLEL